MRRFLRTAIVVLGVVLAPLAAMADELVGQYAAMGATPDGKQYKAAVQIAMLGQIHAILWKLEDGAVYEGIGLRSDDVLGSAYAEPGRKFGLIVYKINGGTLDGTWITSGDVKSELGREKIEGSSNLNGEYKITLGQNRDGLTNYNGTVLLQPTGDTYIWVRTVGTKKTIGVGVRLNDVLVVAVGDGMQMPGVVAYQAQGNNGLTGIWSVVGLKKTGDNSLSIVGSRKTGTETLVRTQ
jgi:hypothetical protein